MEIKLKILAKKSNNKAFKGSDDNWYNLNDNVIPYLEKLNNGDEVVVIYEKKGVSRYVSKLTNSIKESIETKDSSTGFVCEVCGKELKDGKYKKCYTCNKNAPKESIESEPDNKKSKVNYYDNPAKTAQIQRGNALNAAASVASSQQFADPEVAKQFTLLLAEDFLNWLRVE